MVEGINGWRVFFCSVQFRMATQVKSIAMREHLYLNTLKVPIQIEKKNHLSATSALDCTVECSRWQQIFVQRKTAVAGPAWASMVEVKEDIHFECIRSKHPGNNPVTRQPLSAQIRMAYCKKCCVIRPPPQRPSRAANMTSRGMEIRCQRLTLSTLYRRSDVCQLGNANRYHKKQQQKKRSDSVLWAEFESCH